MWQGSRQGQEGVLLALDRSHGAAGLGVEPLLGHLLGPLLPLCVPMQPQALLSCQGTAGLAGSRVSPPLLKLPPPSQSSGQRTPCLGRKLVPGPGHLQPVCPCAT